MKKTTINLKITNHTNDVQNIKIFERPFKKYEQNKPSETIYTFDFSEQIIRKETEVSYIDNNGQIITIELTLPSNNETLNSFAENLNLLGIGTFSVDGNLIIWTNCPGTPFGIEIYDYNFDVDSNYWDASGIVDKESFENVLGVEVELFLKVNNNIKAYITPFSSNNLNLFSMDIFNVNYITYEFDGKLILTQNKLTKFNPLKRLYKGITDINFSDNMFTLQGYSESENWANKLHTAAQNNQNIDFRNCADLVSGTNLENILLQKKWNVISQ